MYSAELKLYQLYSVYRGETTRFPREIVEKFMNIACGEEQECARIFDGHLHCSMSYNPNGEKGKSIHFWITVDDHGQTDVYDRTGEKERKAIRDVLFAGILRMEQYAEKQGVHITVEDRGRTMLAGKDSPLWQEGIPEQGKFKRNYEVNVELFNDDEQQAMRAKMTQFAENMKRNNVEPVHSGLVTRSNLPARIMYHGKFLPNDLSNTINLTEQDKEELFDVFGNKAFSYLKSFYEGASLKDTTALSNFQTLSPHNPDTFHRIGAVEDESVSINVETPLNYEIRYTPNMVYFKYGATLRVYDRQKLIHMQDSFSRIKFQSYEDEAREKLMQE